MTTRIIRDVAAAADEKYDLIIIGGGIYGAMALLESSARGLRPLLLERDDFGAATSFNSLRIVHGGLRYLQSLDLPRFMESVGERSWFLRAFPDLVHPLPCLMPLYGQGMKRPAVLRLALLMNDVLSVRRNRGLAPDSRLPSGKTLGPAATRNLFPSVRTDGLKGSALWHDACVPDSHRLIVEIIRRGVARGGTALNYVCAENLVETDGRVNGVVARDLTTDGTHTLHAQKVINAAGPWCRRLAASFDSDDESLFRSSIAWNVLFDRDAISDHAVAIAPPGPDGHVYFAQPWKDRLLIGTGHGPWTAGPDDPGPSAEQMEAFMDDVNAAVPGLNLDATSVVRIFAGLLPASEEGGSEIAVRETIVDHGARGGPTGLFSVSGVKLTTARLVAAKVLQRAFPDEWKSLGPIPELSAPEIANASTTMAADRPAAVSRALADGARERLADLLRAIREEESVVHLDDLVVRRTSLWEDPDRALAVAADLLELMEWDTDERDDELLRLRRALQRGEALPADALEQAHGRSGPDVRTAV